MMLPPVAGTDWFKRVIVSLALSPEWTLPTADSGTSTFACIGPDSLTDTSGENVTAGVAPACAGGGNSEKTGPAGATDCGPAKSRTPDSPTRSPTIPFTAATVP